MMSSRRLLVMSVIGLCIFFCFPRPLAASFSGYQVFLSDTRPKSNTNILVTFTTSASIPPQSAFHIILSSAFSVPTSTDVIGNVEMRFDGVVCPSASQATVSSCGVEAATDGFILTTPVATTIASGAEIALWMGFADPFRTPSAEGVYAISTGVYDTSGNHLESGASPLLIQDSVTVGAESQGETTESSGGGGGGGSSGSATSAESGTTDSDSSSTDEPSTESDPTVPTRTDIVSDGVIDEADVSALSLIFGAPDADPTFDLNHDHIIDLSDVGILLSNWSANVTSVEPGSSIGSFRIGPPMAENRVVLGIEEVGALRIQTHNQDTSSVLNIAKKEGETFRIVLTLNTGPTKVNALDVTFTYPAKALSLINTYIDDSVLSVWLQIPKAENDTLRFIGGIPGGFSGTHAPLVVLEFEMHGTKDLALAFAPESRVVFDDGQGTAAPVTSEQVVVVASDSSSTVITEHTKSEASSHKLPIISSLTHPFSTQWYNQSTALFTWDAQPGDVGYSYLIDHERTTIPDALVETAASSVSIRSLADGEWMFHLRRLCDGCSEETVSHFLVRVDTTPPADFSSQTSVLDLFGTAFPFVYFHTTDTMSGVAHYRLLLDGQETIVQQGPFVLPALLPGYYDLSIRAVDRAGNSRTATTRVTIDGQSPLWITGWRWLLFIIGGSGLFILLFILFCIWMHKKRSKPS